MKVDMDLEVDSRPTLLRALVFFNAPDNLSQIKKNIISVYATIRDEVRQIQKTN